jgi:hypothetical protein
MAAKRTVEGIVSFAALIFAEQKKGRPWVENRSSSH